MAKPSILALFAAWAASQGALAAPKSSSSVSADPRALGPARRGASPDIDFGPLAAISSSNFDQIKANPEIPLRTYTTTMTSTTTTNITSTTSTSSKTASGYPYGDWVALTSDGPISSDTLSIGLIGTALGLLIGIVMFVL